ncbi:hypothetical protein M422DRAFT_39933 [Sphaerobolus stellatus SS14]|uniref:Uncharacterized protein n=1 Tax=Sphaerobolus stellatus (strain SS14) TaxID=990650 RepID=A0A0C9TLM1_SPHS4|nr:hypothetical protein M422DRAFT_39933 [Sphaerobolus stellatus SS14]
MQLSQLRVVPLPSTAHALSTADHKLTLSQSPVRFIISSGYYLKEYAETYFEAVELGNIVLLVVGIVGNG